MKQYSDLVQHVLDHGHQRGDRTGTGTLSSFGHVIRHDHRTQGFPLLTLKETNFTSIVKELLWFLSGSTNAKDLGCGIWDSWTVDIMGEWGLRTDIRCPVEIFWV